MLHNTELRQQHAAIPQPYIESVDFDLDGIDPLFFTLRDAAQGTHYMDVSNRSLISVVDSLRNVMLIDAAGIHFSTNSCRYDVSITIDHMYQQLANLSGQVCAKNIIDKRVQETDFRQILYLKDQCGKGVRRSIRKYPNLKVGDSDCQDVDVDELSGKWTFDCTFPGSESNHSKCQAAVKKDILRFLFVDPFGGACPDLSTVITTLEATGKDFINPESLRAELYKQGLNSTEKGEADLTIIYYEQLWEIFKQGLSKTRTHPPGRFSSFELYINMYNKYRNFEGDLCDDLHDQDLPLNMSLQAGVTHIGAISTLQAVPKTATAFNITVQDPSQVACCSPGSVSVLDRQTNTCSYPKNAAIGNSSCVCGTGTAGSGLAFEYMECDNFVAKCVSDADCAAAGYGKYKCLVGSCCGRGVCFDPYACAQKGTGLI